MWLGLWQRARMGCGDQVRDLKHRVINQQFSPHSLHRTVLGFVGDKKKKKVELLLKA